MAHYTAAGAAGSAGIDETALSAMGATAARLTITGVVFASASSPADDNGTFVVGRVTADGTGTTVTPAPMDPDDPASNATVLSGHTVEPTYTGVNVLEVPVHQRGTYRHVWAPGREPKVASDAAQGVAVKLSTVETGFAPHATLEWYE